MWNSVELVGFHVLVGFQPGTDVHGVMVDADFTVRRLRPESRNFALKSGVAGIAWRPNNNTLGGSRR